MGKFTGVNSKAVEALERRKQQKELENLKREEERLNKLWQDDDKINKAKEERRLEQQRKQQEKLEKKAELRKLAEKEESELVSNKKPGKKPVVPKVTRAECLRNQLLQSQKESVKQDDYVNLNEDELVNKNHEFINEQMSNGNIDIIAASGIDDVLSSLAIEADHKSIKTTYMEFQERKMAELKEEYPNLKLSQYKDMIYKQWKKSPENPFNNG
ncbi:hypothetical protein MACJ_004043 [Theileria orientalis]|uniref:Coiled-coil domain-containing protein n=1 Tax=Theileria orientalis TaxID=68886 RepID=A0A976SL04_THEOR|nr:hypothetical protein MACJ_004043 [Theileria orientalis]